MKIRYYGCVAQRHGLARPKDDVDRRAFQDFNYSFKPDSEGCVELAYALVKLKEFTDEKYRYVLFENDDLDGLSIPIEECCIQETMFDATT